jgi:RES domain-containing protein
MILYRICKAKYRRTAFSGAGGLEASGRWHHKGRPVVYASASLSLAALEYLVHLGRRDAKIRLVHVEATIPDDLAIEAVDIATLPRDWNESPPTTATMDIGTDWLDRMSGAILKAPSAVIAGEFNYVVNPRHPKFARIKVAAPSPFSFDARLLK